MASFLRERGRFLSFGCARPLDRRVVRRYPLSGWRIIQTIPECAQARREFGRPAQERDNVIGRRDGTPAGTAPALGQ
jgi:hypothetical protein